MGSRRGWLSRFRSPEAGHEPVPPPPSNGDGAGEDSRITHSMLGSLARSRPSAPEAEPPRGSLVSLAGAAAAAPADEDPLPLIEHSMIGQLAGLEERWSGEFPIERGILISIIVHLLLVIAIILVPDHRAAEEGGLIAALTPPERDESPIPVVFHEAPGPSRENPKRSPLSDADRRAGGGDPARPRADTPAVPPSPGIAGLAPGPRSPRVPGAESPSRTAKSGTAEGRSAASESAEKAEAGPSDFPTDMRPQLAEAGPGEAEKPIDLGAAIREAARGAVGGEGGAPQGNPEGGFVDSGPLSFDTTWYDWGPYAAEMVRRIKLHWDVPELARLGWKGSLTVRFFILADGRVADAKILRGSGVPPFDYAAFQAIIKSSPFRPLPADLNSEREGVTVTFFYNLRPESEEARARP